MIAVAAVVFCAALLAAAVLTPAPPAVLPLGALVCIGCPLVMAWHVPVSIAVLRVTCHAAEAEALRSLRRQLDRLPETRHPLGL